MLTKLRALQIEIMTFLGDYSNYKLKKRFLSTKIELRSLIPFSLAKTTPGKVCLDENEPIQTAKDAKDNKRYFNYLS